MQCGEPNVDKMLSKMTTEQLDELMAADELDQFIGLEKLYQILSLIGSAIVGGNAEPKHFIPRSPADIRVKRDLDTQHASPNQMAAIVSLSYSFNTSAS